MGLNGNYFAPSGLGPQPTLYSTIFSPTLGVSRFPVLTVLRM